MFGDRIRCLHRLGWFALVCGDRLRFSGLYPNIKIASLDKVITMIINPSAMQNFHIAILSTGQKVAKVGRKGFYKR
jgi:hypothetical protein